MRLFVYSIILLAVLSAPWSNAAAQSVYFFRNSEQAGYYDSGLAFRGPPSEIEQAGPTGDKLPTDERAYAGANSLRLRWTSRPGGDWSALVIAPGFPFQDISQADTLAFWAFAPEELARENLPLIYLEGAPGATKSRRYSLAPHSDDLPAQTWTQVKIPLDLFFSDPNQTNIDFRQIKAVIFGQDEADGQNHVLLVDQVRAFRGVEGEILAPQLPRARGFDRHIELRWAPPAEGVSPDGYRIFRAGPEMDDFEPLDLLPAADSIFLDWPPDDAPGPYRYQIAALDPGGRASTPSATVSAQIEDLDNDAILDMVQEYTFRYFWDFAHPVSGLARERDTSGDLVTTGGSGFGVMAIVVGIERGFISRAQGLERVLKIVTFLERADRFRGVFPHWLHGETGRVIPFSALDNGGDIVETAFLLQGLLIARAYFDGDDAVETSLRERITQLYAAAEWNWYRKQIENVIYWHWSPDFQFAINLPVRGWNETLMVYLLAIGAPANRVPAGLWARGWAGAANFLNGGRYYNVELPLGAGLGGPLFFTHYSFLGFDPRNRRDQFVNYFTQNRNQTLINRAYCIANPRGHAGYGEFNWGITASDNPFGYLAHEPGNERDNGTLAPTAALSSMPYTPVESMATLRRFYRAYGPRLWGPMGFRDAFNLNEDWFATSYLAIDQGPIIGMIENHRSGLLWSLFMRNPEIEEALNRIGFEPDDTPTSLSDPIIGEAFALRLFPNPVRESGEMALTLFRAARVSIDLVDLNGRTLANLLPEERIPAGERSVNWNAVPWPNGLYLLRIRVDDRARFAKVVIAH